MLFRSLVYHARAPLTRMALAGLRSDPAIIVLITADVVEDEAAPLFAWTRELADSGLRANALVASRHLAASAISSLRKHQAPEPLDIGRGAVYLASDATAALEGALVVATD